MRTKWYDSLDPNAVFFCLFGIVVMVLFLSATVWSQTGRPAPPSAPNPESRIPNAAAVPLTHEEGLEIELNQAKMDNLNLQAERVERQISEARKGLSQDRDDLTAKFAKAHGLDPAKYRLDPQAKAFLPVPAPPAAATKGGNQK